MEHDADDPDLWLRSFCPATGARTQLVCFPHAGGSASAYHAMATALSPEVDVLAVQYPGRQDRRSERCVTSVPELVDRLIPVLEERIDHRPLALFGHSLGAIAAFETARRLEGGEGPSAPVTVFLSGRRAPHFVREGRVHLRDDRGLLRELELLGGPAAAVLADPEMARMFLPAIRADYRAAETHVHVPGPPLRSPVVALTGDDDPCAAVEEVEPWREHTEGSFALHVFPGGHFFLNDRPEDVHRIVRQRLLSLPVR